MTRTTRTLTLMVVSLLALLPALHASADQRTETKDYAVGADTLIAECELGTELETGLGGACFDLNGNETSAAIDISDLTSMPTPGGYAFYSPGGNLNSFGLFCASTTAAVPPGSAELVVYVAGPAVGAISCLDQGSLGAATMGTITVTFNLSDEQLPPGIDVERECLQPTPAAASVYGVTDDGGRLTLNVKVFLDDTSLEVDASPEVAEKAFATAAESYDPLGIDLAVSSIETLDPPLEGDDAQQLLSQVKARLGGERPEGVDIVYILTTKDIQVLGQSAVLGLADCVGGVRYPDRAFAIGEVFDSEIPFGPVTFYRHGTARVAAHEIGHLMGGHHHYANCVERAASHAQVGDPPCSLMSNFVDMLGGQFGTLNGAVVRGHAEEYTGTTSVQEPAAGHLPHVH